MIRVIILVSAIILLIPFHAMAADEIDWAYNKLGRAIEANGYYIKADFLFDKKGEHDKFGCKGFKYYSINPSNDNAEGVTLEKNRCGDISNIKIWVGNVYSVTKNNVDIFRSAVADIFNFSFTDRAKIYATVSGYYNGVTSGGITSFKDHECSLRIVSGIVTFQCDFSRR